MKRPRHCTQADLDTLAEMVDPKRHPKTMRFTKHNDLIFTTVVTLRGREIAFRLDGRDGTWRVDVKTHSLMPWEAIDGGQGFLSQVLARKFVSDWYEAAKEQNTLWPSSVQPNRMPC